MINSFWNICSTCPMPKEEKLNSEYKRNYVWHPIYKSVPQDVINIPPQALAKEMGIQRKKQYPDLAYRTNEVIGTDCGSKDTVDVRTRSEERGFGAALKSGPRSRSAEPGVCRQSQKTMIQSYPPLMHGRGAPMPKMEEVPNDVQKNTEYRSQFDWPRHSAGRICTARKSISMGLIKAPDQPDGPLQSRNRCDALGIYQKLPTQEEESGTIKEANIQDLKKKAKTEYKAKYKPFTSYVYIDGQWKKTSRLMKIPEHHGSQLDCPWYSDVIERLQRANEYKCRGHGHPIYGDGLPSVHTKRHDVTPVSRPKQDIPEIHIPVVAPESKPAEGKRKERREKKTQPTEKKTEKKKESRRPKSADPVKERKPLSQQRPQTAPPPVKERIMNPVPAHHAYAKKSAVKSQGETRMKISSRTPSARKQKEYSSRSGLPFDGRASRTSHHPPASSAGKVWLQAGAPVPEAPSSENKESFKGKHSDAVRPSTLLPPPPKSPSPPSIATQKPEQSEARECGDSQHKTASSTVPLTHVQTPEEVTGVKSPEPENWTVPLDKGQKLQWTESSTNEPLLPHVRAASPKTEVIEEHAGSASQPVLAETGTSEEPGAQKTPLAAMKLTTADVLDRARSRLDQFWGKNK